MNLIDRLKELEAKAKAVPYQPGNIDERTDTAESFDFAYALQDAWPKLLAFVEAFDKWNKFVGPEDRHEFGWDEVEKARKALDQ